MTHDARPFSFDAHHIYRHPEFELHQTDTSPLYQYQSELQLNDTRQPAFCYTNQCLYIATDSLALRPLYHTVYQSVYLISDSAQLLHNVTGRTTEFSGPALAGWLSGQPMNHLCAHQQIAVLAAGHRLEFADDTVKVSKYWDIDPSYKLRFPDDDTYAAYFKDCLDTVIAAQMATHEVIATQMSGGMDSTSITALASLQAKAQNKKCIALSHFYPGDSASDESELINDMRHHLSLTNVLSQTVDTQNYRDFLSLYPAHFDHPGIVLSPRYNDELAMLAKQDVTLLLTGNGGDETCWGHASAYTQRLLNKDFSVIPEVYQACRVTGMPFLKVARHLFVRPMIPGPLITLAKALKRNSKHSLLPLWLTPKARTMAEESFTISNPFDAKRAPMNHARYFAMKNSTTFNSVRSYDEVSKQHNIKVCHPFFDQTLVEASFALPEKQLIRGAYPKFILRNAMNGLLPDSVCWKTTKTTFDIHFANLVKENRDSLRQCIQHPLLADMGLLDINQALQAFDDTLNNNNSGIKVDLLFLILTQRWVAELVN
ncbi:asparagine synthase [Salinimonas marina]|uniref:asparagine synthase (glutamine-hydrolyzing) n=1 Tax=Salinimonas marina TaxID=2785918 RepID=A0A7S9DWC8_9ALTE|nr:asparagine synthetase B family protein [Salinimonas marina]QPG05144.1 asparagine synthase [Salinimonas marina]